jgi:hypothetical protein
VAAARTAGLANDFHYPSGTVRHAYDLAAVLPHADPVAVLEIPRQASADALRLLQDPILRNEVAAMTEQSRESRLHKLAQLLEANYDAYASTTEGLSPLGWNAIRSLLPEVVAALRSSLSETATINAAQIIGWASTVRNASPIRKWTDTEIKLADAIMGVASGE